jgi:hypothetical protein
VADTAGVTRDTTSAEERRMIDRWTPHQDLDRRELRHVAARSAAEPERRRLLVRRDGSERRFERPWRDDYDLTRGRGAVGKGEELRPVEVTV